MRGSIPEVRSAGSEPRVVAEDRRIHDRTVGPKGSDGEVGRSEARPGVCFPVVRPHRHRHQTRLVSILETGTADPRDFGFWKVVGTVKRDPTLTDRFADRIGAIDQAVFTAWAPLTAPLVAGTALGLGLIGMF